MINRPRLLELFCEFAKKIEAIHSLYLDSVVGYSVLHERLLEHQDQMQVILGNLETATREFQNTCHIAYGDLSNRDFQAVSMSPMMLQGALAKRVSDDGENTLLLGNQCIITAYTYWEEYLRLEIGKALGKLSLDATLTEDNKKILNKYVKSDFWGDLRYLRHSIVHGNGIATSDMAHCKLIKWFKPGEPIVLTHERMQAIFMCMGEYRNAIHQWSLPPPRKMRIPISKS